MSKFSDLLNLKLLVKVSLLFLLTACVSAPVVMTDDDTVQSATATQPEIQVDKQSNSIKITPEVAPLQKSKKVKLKPRFQFDWPVWEARMTRGFLPRGTKRRKRPHKGIDLAAPRGTAVMSSHDGSVIYTGKGFKGYGKMVLIR